MNISVLINSCDKYEFIWNKFFHLFDKYWDKSKNLPIYFLTEHKTPSRNDIYCVTTDKTSWSDRIQEVLSTIDTKYVLWLQDDYFLRRKIDISLLENYLNFIEDNKVDRFGIHEHSYLYSLTKDVQSNFFRYKQNSLYTISMQASIWNKEFFQSCFCDKQETIWEFEVDGSIRLNTRPHKIYLDTQINPWYQEALRKGEYTTEYFTICKEENL